ncbi:MAG: delta-60 repeat domain-containing protein [Opitutaceae bacterium]
MVGGAFTSIGGSARVRLARLNPAGTLDTGFQVDANETVTALAVQSGGGIIVAGSFTQIGGIARPYLARVLSDGTVDASFNPAPNGPVHSIALQPDGSMLIGGAFTSIGGGSRAGLARLTAAGLLDAAFRADTDSAVRSVVLLSNGRPFLGGGFTLVGGQARFLTARLGATSSLSDKLAVDGSRTSISWTRDGAVPEITGAFFATSTDGNEWVSVGFGTRISGQKTWTVNLTEALPAAAGYFIRAEGIVPTNGGSSSGTVRSVAQFYGNTPSGPVDLGQSPDTSDAADQSGGSDGSEGTGGSSPGSDTSGGADAGGNGSIGAGATFDWTQIAPDSSSHVTFTNLSTRVRLQPARSFITGFSIDGPSSKPVLIRAVGPGLAGFGIGDPLPSPRVEVLDQRGSPVAVNDGWSGNPAIAAAGVTVGAFDLLPENADAALRVDLPAGSYTVRVSDSNGLPGVVLAEIYDLELESGLTSSRLVNVSSRGPVASGSGVATGGFNVAGDEPAHLLIRAVGPGMTAFGVKGALADPVLRVFTGDGRMVARNDDWNVPFTVDALYPAYRAADFAEAAARTGAFALESGSLDSVVLIEAAPGTYTAQATGSDGTTGEIIIEVYLLK